MINTEVKRNSYLKIKKILITLAIYYIDYKKNSSKYYKQLQNCNSTKCVNVFNS